MATGRIGTTPVLQVRWSKAPTNGTTSLSGLDDNSVSLVYSVGYEAVYRNGVLLSRTNDYTATDGTTVTLIDATITGDIIEIFANQTIPLSDTYSQTVADGKFINNTLTTTTGDIIYASGANTPARLAIGTSADVLTVSGGIPAWAAPAGGGMTLLSTTTLSGTTVNITGISGSYNDLQIVIKGFDKAGAVRLNGSTNTFQGIETYMITTTITRTGYNNTELRLNAGDGVSASNTGAIVFQIFDYANTTSWKAVNQWGGFTGSSHNTTMTYVGHQKTTSAITSVTIVADGAASFGAGTVLIYGVK
jgi:hypothetical protein